MQVEKQHYSWSDAMKCAVSLLDVTFVPSTVAYRLAANSRLRLFSLQAIADLLQYHCKLHCAFLDSHSPMIPKLCPAKIFGRAYFIFTILLFSTATHSRSVG